MTYSNNLKPGQMLVGAIFVIVIFSILGIELASLLSSEGYSTIQNYSGVRALNVAEGGVRFTVATSLAATAIWSNSSLKKFGPVTLSPGTFSVTYDSISQYDVTFEVAGTVSGPRVSALLSAPRVKGATKPISGLTSNGCSNTGNCSSGRPTACNRRR